MAYPLRRIARIHRISQIRSVRVINFVARGTIREGMFSVLAFKRSLARILDGGGSEISLGAGPDPWQALMQVGSQCMGALAAANDPRAPVHPWIERDPATGAQNLKMPLPSPETAGQLANEPSALADSSRGGTKRRA
jgi:hypothetical protein